MRRTLTVAVVAAAVLTVAPVAASSPNRGGYPPCQHEDSTGCVWDARHMGNGSGRSFLATRDGRVIYLPHRAAHALTLPGVW